MIVLIIILMVEASCSDLHNNSMVVLTQVHCQLCRVGFCMLYTTALLIWGGGGGMNALLIP